MHGTFPTRWRCRRLTVCATAVPRRGRSSSPPWRSSSRTAYRRREQSRRVPAAPPAPLKDPAREVTPAACVCAPPTQVLGGYNAWTWAYVVICATMGLSVSFVFKFLDNIWRIFALGVATALTALLSWPLLGQEPSISEICDIVTIFLSLIVYSTTHDGAMAKPKGPALTADEAKPDGIQLPTEEDKKIEKDMPWHPYYSPSKPKESTALLQK